MVEDSGEQVHLLILDTHVNMEGLCRASRVTHREPGRLHSTGHNLAAKCWL